MPTQTQLHQALTEVTDPEYPISVVDMGLIRSISVEGQTAKVGLTFCSLGCPCVEMIRDDIEARLLRCEGVTEVVIEEVFDPWSRKDISQRGVAKLRELGVG
jgi:metal-sulfur cluster biosynthetic enzyme